ncbi:MAG: hypothetical protein NUV94_08175 [Candidatus Acetothermia bacterium]|nr:hypothetical protein [Candidatus Acetothermia bacterium]
MIVLNPSPMSLAGPKTGSQGGVVELTEDVKSRTRCNCTKRGDPRDQVEKRVNSIDEELPAWRALIRMGAREYTGWQFPEYLYREGDEISVLGQAWETLIRGTPKLTAFFA